jgi:hypothetical protein
MAQAPLVEVVVCTVKDKRAVLVCDLALARVRQEVAAAFGDRVSFTHVDFQPTLVEATPDVDAERFIAIVLAASAAAQSPLGREASLRS